MKDIRGCRRRCIAESLPHCGSIRSIPSLSGYRSRNSSLDKGSLFSYSTSNGLTENTLRIDIHGSYAGYFGQIRKGLQKLISIEQEVFVAELSVSSLLGKKSVTYEQLPKFPKVRRDVAFLVDEAVSAEKLESAIRGAASNLLKRIELFDLYRGEPLEPGKKSLAFTLELMSTEKTLTDQEIDEEIRRVVRHVEGSVGASLRSLS